MPKLSKIIVPAAVAAIALTAALPAQAQPYQYERRLDHRPGTYPQFIDRDRARATEELSGRIRDLQDQITRYDRRDAITSREAAGLNRWLGQVRRTFQRDLGNGLSPNEYNPLKVQLERIGARLDELRAQSDVRDHRGLDRRDGRRGY